MNFLTIGINMRDVACSLVRAGHTAYSVNYFNPLDLRGCSNAVSSLLGTECITTEHISGEQGTWKAFLVEQAQKMLEKWDIDYIVPRINNELIDPLKRYAPIVGNSLDRLEVPRDKWEVHQRALAAGLAVPRTWSADENIELGGLSFPLVVKPARGSRGTGVQLVGSWNQMKSLLKLLGPEKRHILQERIIGESYNVNFLSDGKRVLPLFVSRQLFNQDQGFIHEGNIGPVHPRGVEEAIDTYAGFLEGFGLKGVMGVDFILDASGEFYLIDFNPRVQGSFEVIEESLGINMFEYHFNAWRGRLPEIPRPERFAGKRIINSNRECRAPGLIDCGFVRDVPHENAKLNEGEPLCTVVASGTSAKEVEVKLAERVEYVLGGVI